MKALLRVALIATLSVPACLAQTGAVTFYSPGISVKSEGAVFLPKSRQPFSGWLVDGQQRLARLRHGRFVTFHLNAGTHSFTTSGPTGPGKEPLVIDVKDGGQYCSRLFAKMTDLQVYARWENQIEDVPCQRAYTCKSVIFAKRRIQYCPPSFTKMTDLQ